MKENTILICMLPFALILLLYGLAMLKFGEELYGHPDVVLIWSGGMAFCLSVQFIGRFIGLKLQDLFKKKQNH